MGKVLDPERVAQLQKAYPDCPNAVLIFENNPEAVEHLRNMVIMRGLSPEEAVPRLMDDAQNAPLAPLAEYPTSEELRQMHLARDNEEYRTEGFRRFLVAVIYGAM